jgi:hypothetical protein
MMPTTVCRCSNVVKPLKFCSLLDVEGGRSPFMRTPMTEYVHVQANESDVPPLAIDFDTFTLPHDC